MKRITMILAMLILLAGLVPLAWAGEPAGPTPAPPDAAAVNPSTQSSPQHVLYFWDFEGNDGGFAGTLDWEWGTYAWHGSTCDSSNYPPPAPYSGTDMWGTPLNDCYVNRGNNGGYNTCINTNPNDDSILSVTIDLTGITGATELSWWEWYDLFMPWDWAEVYANDDVVFQHCGGSFVQPTAWEQQVVDLTPYIGGPVTIRFHMLASTVVNHAGWYIDDVMITTEVPPPIVWDKTIDGVPWTPDLEITRQTSDTIVVQEVLHLTPPPLGGVTLPAGAWQPNLPVAPAPLDRLPETVGGALPPAPTVPAGTPRPLQAGGLLYKTSLDIGPALFEVYDPATDAWTALAPFETGCQMAVSAAGELYAYGYNTGTINRYDPANDAWPAVMPAPPGASGQYCNLEITTAGEFLYTQVNGTTLWYTAGGVWNTLSLPFTGNAMGDYDPTADQYVVGQFATTNAHMIDVHTWAITDYTSPLGNGEYARFGVVLGNRYYFEAGGSNIHSFDLGNPAAPPLDHGVNLSWFGSAAGDRPNAAIYVASLDGQQLWRYDTVTNAATPLAGGSYGWHSSLAYVPPVQGPVFAQIETWDPEHLHLVDWAATGGDVIVEPDRLVWTGMILEPTTITLTKWFHVAPCTWTTTLLWEELWLDGVELEQRPVVIHKLPPVLGIDAAYEPLVCPGQLAEFIMQYENVGGYENDVVVYTEFPPEAPFVGSDPPPDAVDPAGLWAEWWVGDLPQGAAGLITVTVEIADTVLPGDLLSIDGWVIDHVGDPADMIEIVFHVGAPDITINPAALGVELCPDATTELPLAICNVGPCPLVWALDTLTPTLWLSADPTSGTLPPAMCQTVTVSLDAAGLLPGDYLAALLIDSNDPETPQVSVPVTLTVPEPVALLTVTTVITDLTVAFFPDVSGSEPIAYGWDFGDGMTSTEVLPVHTYAAAGCYTVTLEVENACGGDDWTGTVCVGAPCDPVDEADFVWAPEMPLVDQVVHFTATAAGSTPLTYAWDLGDGHTAAGEFVSHAYTAAGTYTVRMTATNDCGEDYATYDLVVVAECVPPFGADFAWLPLNPTAGQVVAFTGSVTGTTPLTFAWAFGDGATGAGNPINHTYVLSGTYTVAMTATNACGDASATHDVVVSGAAPPPTHFIYLPLIVRPGS